MGVMFGHISLYCRLSCGHDISVSTSYECRSSKRVPLVLKVRASGAIENERSPPRPSFPPCYHSRMPSLTSVAIIVLALLIAAALYLVQQIMKS